MFEYLKSLSEKYDTTFENVLSIALNRYGIIIDNFNDNRIRFDLDILNNNHNTFFAVCVNTYEKSPFKLCEGKLYLENNLIGNVYNIEKDTCTSTYFRNNKKAITFNSNSRSKCSGCTFCGTYSLDENEIEFKSKEIVQEYFKKLLLENSIKSMKNIENITICTGCFENEDALFNHLLLLNDSFKEMNFNGSINYIGSQLRDYEKIKSLKSEIGDFGIYLTIEKFLNRERFMRKEKASLTMDKCKDLLSFCSDIGVTSTFLYILGLEDLQTVKKYFSYFKDSINKFPIIQVFQDYTKYQENLRIEQAKDIDYYLEAKKIINNIFKGSHFNIKLWESFRGIYDKEDIKKMVLK